MADTTPDELCQRLRELARPARYTGSPQIPEALREAATHIEAQAAQVERLTAERDALKAKADECDARRAFEDAEAPMPWDLEPGYSWAVGELTRRKAWSKSAIAAIIAEQRNRAAEAVALLREALEDYPDDSYEMDQIEGRIDTFLTEQSRG